MRLPPEPSCMVPEGTAKVAQAALPHGNRYMQMREAFGTLYTKAQFADLYRKRNKKVAVSASITASATFGHSASPDNVTMALQ